MFNKFVLTLTSIITNYEEILSRLNKLHKFYLALPLRHDSHPILVRFNEPSQVEVWIKTSLIWFSFSSIPSELVSFCRWQKRHKQFRGNIKCVSKLFRCKDSYRHGTEVYEQILCKFFQLFYFSNGQILLWWLNSHWKKYISFILIIYFIFVSTLESQQLWSLLLWP